MTAAVQPLGYGVSVALGGLAYVALCAAVRRRPGRWVITAARAIGLVLLADA